MAIDYTWNCRSVTAYVDLEEAGNSYPDAVFKINWTLMGVEVVGSTSYSFGQSGLQAINVSSLTPETFIPFDELTNEIATQWCTTAMGPEQVASIEAYIAEQIQNQINNPTVNLYIGSTPAPTPPVVE